MHEVDLDSPVDEQAEVRRGPRLRRAAGLAGTGVVLLACQEVLGPMASTWLFAGSPSVSDGWETACAVACFGVFVAGLVLLVVGGVRFAGHVHVLAERALQQPAAPSAAAPAESR